MDLEFQTLQEKNRSCSVNIFFLHYFSTFSRIFTGFLYYAAHFSIVPINNSFHKEPST